MQFINIRGYSVALPAVIIAAVGLFIGVSMIVVTPKLFLAGLSVMASFLIAAYNVNCVVVGSCEMWAWTLFGLFIVALLASGGLAFWRYGSMTESEAVGLLDPRKGVSAVERVVESSSKSIKKTLSK
jgi:hypothetical protein